MRKVIGGLTVLGALAVPASVAHGQGPGECFLPPGNAQRMVAQAPGTPNEFWQEGFGFRRG